MVLVGGVLIVLLVLEAAASATAGVVARVED